MAHIHLEDLKPIGLDLLEDKESFLYDLTDDSVNVVGGIPSIPVTISVIRVPSSEDLWCVSISRIF